MINMKNKTTYWEANKNVFREKFSELKLQIYKNMLSALGIFLISGKHMII